MDYYYFMEKKANDVQECSYRDNNDQDDGVILEDNQTGGRMDISGILEVCSKRLVTFKEILIKKVKNSRELQIQTGTNIKSVSKDVIYITTFINNLCKLTLGRHPIEKSIVESKILVEIVNFLSIFPWNNILSLQIKEIIQSVFTELKAPSNISDHI